MKLSQFFLPLLKEDPAEASVISHKLMLRAGLIRQQSSGIYVWLPLGLKVLKNIEKIIRKHHDEAGLCEILMPCIQPASLWKESGRYDDYGKEMLRITDRHENELLFGPTNEEIVTEIARKNIFSYKNLPQNLYQIQWKFRDEIRPRFGVMRGREFLMKDAYSFDLTTEESRKTYELMFRTYFKIFQNLGIKAVAVRAENGAIGGDLSHEFHVLADTGESAIFYDSSYEIICQEMLEKDAIDFEKLNSLYAAADEKHDPENCPIPLEKLQQKRGIEVGHIFNFGQKYSKSMNFTVTDANGKAVFPEMGSYGIGVSRLVAAIIEASFDEKGIIWPKNVSPFDVAVVCLKTSDEETFALSEKIYSHLKKQNFEVLFDDTKESVGVKFSCNDLIGTPFQLIVGPKLMQENVVELKERKTGISQKIAIDQIFNQNFGEILK